MARFFLELAYNGTRYCGWQVQPDAPSVQQTLEKALAVLLSQECPVVGAGRTDAGVHARYYVAHFDASDRQKVLSPDFIYHLNCLLPYDIAVSAVREVRSDAHARFHAVEREYTYYVSRRKNPFFRGLSAFFSYPLEVARMNEAASLLLRNADFTSFARLHADNKTNICRVTVAEWREEGEQLVFVIRADRFLRNMVRAVVGSLLDVGRGKRTVADFAGIIEAKNRGSAGSSAPAEGLYLTDVVYPSEIYVEHS